MIDAFTCSYTVSKGSTAFTFASSGTTAATFGLSISASGCTAAVNSSSGAITVSAVAANSATITVTVTDRAAGSTIATRVITLTKTLTGSDGSPGAAGKQTVVSYVYHQASSSSQPSTPSATSYNVTNNTFSGLTSGWATTPPTFAAGNSNKYWYSYFRAEENTAGGGTASGSNLTFQASLQGIGFSGLVTFSGSTLTDGSTTTTPIEAGDVSSHLGGANTTTIDLSLIHI